MSPIRTLALRLAAVASLAPLAVMGLMAHPGSAVAQTPEIKVVTDGSGSRLQVDGEDFMVLGMNWDYFPVGTTYSYNFWAQPDDMIQAALDREMSLLKAMGVNSIRQYAGVPPRWVRYIYEKHGIFTVLNHPVASTSRTPTTPTRPPAPRWWRRWRRWSVCSTASPAS